MKAFKIPADQRILLLDPRKRVTRLRLVRALYLTRWAGELPEDGVLTPRGLAAGCCGHYSAFKWRILLHRHPGDQPVPEDMKAALRGEAPVPGWFRQAGAALRGEEPDEPSRPAREPGHCPDGRECASSCGRPEWQCSRWCRVCQRLAFTDSPPCPACPNHRQRTGARHA